MRLFSTTMSTGPRGGPPVPSINVAPRITIVLNGPTPSPGARLGAGVRGSRCTGPAVDAHHIELGIDDPILQHIRAFIEPPLDRLVALARARRSNLDDQLRSAANMLSRQDLRCTLA